LERPGAPEPQRIAGCGGNAFAVFCPRQRRPIAGTLRQADGGGARKSASRAAGIRRLPSRRSGDSAGEEQIVELVMVILKLADVIRAEKPVTEAIHAGPAPTEVGAVIVGRQDAGRAIRAVV
jgi:hypothetical protein